MIRKEILSEIELATQLLSLTNDDSEQTYSNLRSRLKRNDKLLDPRHKEFVEFANLMIPGLKEDPIQATLLSSFHTALLAFDHDITEISQLNEALNHTNQLAELIATLDDAEAFYPGKLSTRGYIAGLNYLLNANS